MWSFKNQLPFWTAFAPVGKNLFLLSRLLSCPEATLLITMRNLEKLGFSVVDQTESQHCGRWSFHQPSHDQGLLGLPWFIFFLKCHSGGLIGTLSISYFEVEIPKVQSRLNLQWIVERAHHLFLMPIQVCLWTQTLRDPWPSGWLSFHIQNVLAPTRSRGTLASQQLQEN